jgi:hypothetical protein
LLSRHQPEQRKSSSQNDPQTKAEEAAASRTGMRLLDRAIRQAPPINARTVSFEFFKISVPSDV